MRRRDERGAFAILYAILAVVLLGIAALAVDIGNGVARKSDVQGQADFAALSAARLLGSQNSGTVPSNVVAAVRDALNENRPLNNNGTCSTATPCVTSADLTDGNEANGEVRFANGGLQVLTHNSNVNFGFAGIFGVDGADTQGDATVGVFSPLGALPLYAVTPCDYGRQTVTDPASGQVPAVTIPTLTFDSDTNNTTLVSVSPNQIALNTSGVTLSLVGSRFDNTIEVGFFPSDGGAPLIASSFKDESNVVHQSGTPLPYSTSGSSQHTITFAVPAAVSSSEQVWYIRVFNLNGPTATAGKWSAKTQAPAFRVGEPVLECDAGSSDGNFGSLTFPRNDVTSVNNQLAMNLATNLEEPLTLTKHLQWDSTGLCIDGINGAVFSSLPNPGLRDHTNCVDTDTGLPANAATAGFITGDGIPAPGRLASAPTTSGCSPNGNSANRQVLVQSTNYSINNDVLTCFLTDGTTSLYDISRSSYNGEAVLDDSIYESPRFFFVPVLHVEPVSGGSATYSIVDFRPAFLTDEAVATTSIKGSNSATSDNGIVVESNQLKQIKVVFFNAAALPSRTGGGVTDYFGVGPRIIRLID